MQVWVCIHSWCDDATVVKVVDSQVKADAWKATADAEDAVSSFSAYTSDYVECYEVE